jgi:hypothetical protein
MIKRAVLVLLLAVGMPLVGARAQPAPDAEHPGTFLLTVFLKHDESKTLGDINQELKRNGWYRDLPPPGVEVVSWYVLMGVGQVVTLRVPADKLREVNRVIESSAWGGYRTEFYPTYDYRQAWEAQKKQMNTP